MNIKLLTEHHLEFLSLKGGCTGSSKFTLVKMPHCWKSHVAAQICDSCNIMNIAIIISQNSCFNETSLFSYLGRICVQPLSSV